MCLLVECITVKLDRHLASFMHLMIDSKIKTASVRELIAYFLISESSAFCREL